MNPHLSALTGAPRGQYKSPFGSPPPSATNPVLPAIPSVASQRRSLDQWVEPALPAQKPSFAEAGFERHGVVANMAPLGTLPSAKVLKAVAKDHGRGTMGRESGPSSASTPQDTAATPEPSADLSAELVRRRSISTSRQPSVVRMEETDLTSRPPSAASALEPFPVLDAAMEGISPSYTMPPTGELCAAITSANTAAAAQSNMSSFATNLQTVAPSLSMPQLQTSQTPSTPYQLHPLQTQQPISLDSQSRNATPLPFSATPTPVQQNMGQSVFSVQRPAIAGPAGASKTASQAGGLPYAQHSQFSGVTTERVVEAAVQCAVDARRWPTAYALRTVYDNHKGNPRMIRLIDAVFNQRADEQQIRDFMAVMKFKKKEGKMDGRAEYYFNGLSGADAMGLESTPGLEDESPATKTASPSLAGRFTSTDDAPVASTPTPAPALGNAIYEAASTAARRSRVSSGTTTPERHDDEHIRKKVRGNDHQPSTSLIGDKAASVSVKVKPYPSSADVPGTSSIPGRPSSRSNSITSTHTMGDDVATNGDALTAMPSGSTGRVTEGRPAAEIRSRSGSAESGISGASAVQGESRFASLVDASANTSTSGSGSGSQGVAEPHPSTTTSLRTPAPPISGKLEPGPKTFTFSTLTTNATPNNPAVNTIATITTTTSPSPSALPHLPTSTPTSTTHSKKKSSHSAKGHARDETASASASASASEMPSAAPVSSSSFPSKTVPSGKASHKKQKAIAEQNKPPPRLVYDETDLKQRKQREVRAAALKNQGEVVESFERFQPPKKVTPSPPSPASSSSLSEHESLPDEPLEIPEIAPRAVPRIIFKTSARSRPVNDDHSDTLSSPTVLSFHNDRAPGSGPASRAGTPAGFGRASRKAKAAGSGLRVKSSPMKNKAGTAGIPRASGEGNSPTGNGVNGQDDNDDYCSACGGNGELVCCDGCTRSYHYICVDPPLDKTLPLPDQWHCNDCKNTGINRRSQEATGLFGALLINLSRKNPDAFSLPKDIREHFENVKTGTLGEYEEDVVVMNKTRSTKAGWEEAQDIFKLRDSKGKIILCHQCNGQACAPDRAIVTCNFCPLSWHLDCINPPLAKEPVLNKPFKCPAHIDDLLLSNPADLGPAHRFRKIKSKPPVVFRPTHRNHGHIEVENDPTDDEAELNFYEKREFGQTYKLSEESIKLDFINQCHSKYGHVRQPQPSPKRQKLSHATDPLNGTWTQRNLHDQQAALNIASLIHGGVKLDNANMLIQALYREAPPAVINMMAMANSGEINKDGFSDSEKQGLLALKAFIDSKLQNVDLKVETKIPSTERAQSESTKPITPSSELASPLATEAKEEPDNKEADEKETDVETEGMDLD